MLNKTLRTLNTCCKKCNSLNSLMFPLGNNCEGFWVLFRDFKITITKFDCTESGGLAKNYEKEGLKINEME